MIVAYPFILRLSYSAPNEFFSHPNVMCCMTMPEFEQLSVTDQMDHLQEDGVYIGKKKALNGTQVLYQYESFYVEIYYLDYRLKIGSIRCFTSIEGIDPYLHPDS